VVVAAGVPVVEPAGALARQEKRSSAHYEGEGVMKKPGIVLLLAILVSLVLSTPALASPSFSDVPNGSVFYQYVTRLAEQGIVSGFPAASFHPMTSSHVNSWPR